MFNCFKNSNQINKPNAESGNFIWHLFENFDYDLLRRKILHRDKEYLEYGTETNFVRSMLYVGFLLDIQKEVERCYKAKNNFYAILIKFKSMLDYCSGIDNFFIE